MIVKVFRRCGNWFLFLQDTSCGRLDIKHQTVLKKIYVLQVMQPMKLSTYYNHVDLFTS